MVNPNKRVKRPNGLGELFKYQTDEDDKIYTLPIKKMLEDNYVYIYRAINKEDYYISDNESCFFFKEIVFDNEVIGFATYRTSSLDNQSLVMQHIYVLPEFRGNNLLEEELDEATLLFNSNIIIQSPNRYVVESLINHKLARVFDDRIVISRIAFMIPMVELEDVKSGVYLEDYDLTDNKGLSKVSLVYDLDLCAVVGLAQENGNDDYDDSITQEDNPNNYNNLSLARKVDDKDFNCLENRSNDKWLNNDEYFDKVRDILNKNDEVIQNWLSLF